MLMEATMLFVKGQKIMICATFSLVQHGQTAISANKNESFYTLFLAVSKRFFVIR